MRFRQFKQFKFVEASRNWALPLTEVERTDADITKIKKDYAELLSQLSDLGETARTKLLGKFSEKHNLQGMYDPQTGYYVGLEAERIRGEETGKVIPKISASGSMTGANDLAALGLIPDIKMDQFKDQVTSADPDSKLQSNTLEILNKQLKATADTEPTATQEPELTAATIKADQAVSTAGQTPPITTTAAADQAVSTAGQTPPITTTGQADQAVSTAGQTPPITTTGQADQAVDPADIADMDDAGLDPNWRKPAVDPADIADMDDAGLDPDWKAKRDALSVKPDAEADAPPTAAPAERVTYQTLAKLSGIDDPNKIGIGQKIKLPGGGEYTVKAGDTLSQIAQDVRLGNIGAPPQATTAPTARPDVDVAPQVAGGDQGQTITARPDVDVAPQGAEEVPTDGGAGDDLLKGDQLGRGAALAAAREKRDADDADIAAAQDITDVDPDFSMMGGTTTAPEVELDDPQGAGGDEDQTPTIGAGARGGKARLRAAQAAAAAATTAPEVEPRRASPAARRTIGDREAMLAVVNNNRTDKPDAATTTIGAGARGGDARLKAAQALAARTAAQLTKKVVKPVPLDDPQGGGGDQGQVKKIKNIDPGPMIGAGYDGIPRLRYLAGIK